MASYETALPGIVKEHQPTDHLRRVVKVVLAHRPRMFRVTRGKTMTAVGIAALLPPARRVEHSTSDIEVAVATCQIVWMSGAQAG